MESRTRDLIDKLLQLDWFRTEPILAHMRAYFSQGDLLLRYPVSVTRSSNVETVGNSENLHNGVDDATKKFLCYVLLDFATVDPDLMPASIVETAVLAHALGFGNEYESTVKSELRLKKKEIFTVFAEVAKRTAPRKTQRSGTHTSQDPVLNESSGEAPGDSVKPIDTKGGAQ